MSLLQFLADTRGRHYYNLGSIIILQSTHVGKDHWPFSLCPVEPVLVWVGKLSLPDFWFDVIMTLDSCPSSQTPQASREQMAIAEFARSLLVIPKQLAVNAAQDATDLVAKLRAYHNDSQTKPERADLRW